MNKTSQPHLLFITTDELRKDALSCYGGQAVSTPHIDSIADGGIRFDRAYTNSPWCLPSRCAMLTGRYPHRSGAYSNFRKCELSTGVPNLLQGLRESGYRTSLFGKCHFSPVPYGETRADRTLPYEAFRDYYLSLGLDHLDLQDDKQVSVWFYDDYAKELDAAGYLEAYRRDTWDVEGKRRKVFPFPGPAEWHPDSWVGRKAEEYIESYDDDRPLFAWVSFSGPHYPFDAPAEYFDRVDMSKDRRFPALDGEFDDPRRIHYRSFHGPGNIDGANSAPEGATKHYSEPYWHDLRRSYYANMAQIDDWVGRILDTARRKLGDNVMVVFTADHGEMLGNHNLWGKHDCGYEDVLNVPLLVRYPAANPHSNPNPFAGDSIVSRSVVQLIDLAPTFLSAAGQAEWESDGRDLRLSLEDGGYRYTFAEGEGFIAVSDGAYKLVQTRKQGREYDELFDLAADPRETDNRIKLPEYVGELARLRNEIVNHFMAKVLA
ncbi:sulfatase [Cohnella cellulosilytica]|uniref:Sulfatase n=1 Tax=Cohnella cellulosilytica TaxID=986710 RepID=A0ABW2F6K0_9BACL